MQVAGRGPQTDCYVNDDKVTEPDQEVSEKDFGTEGLMIRKGKKAFHRIVLK